MAGRYEGELILRLAGDAQTAKGHIPTARALVGQVLEQADFNSLNSHLLRRVLPDGTLIVAEKIGALRRATITTGGGSGKRPVRVFDDILTIAGAEEFDASGNRVLPPVILGHDDEMNWTAYFASSRAPGWHAGAATYGDVFPQVMDNDKRLFGGNCFHRNKDGLITSWWSAAICLGPQARHPAKAYSITVYALGMQVYSILEAGGQAGAYNRVLAAAIRDDHLLVLLANLGTLDYPLRPPVPLQEADAWASKLYSDDASPTALMRYKLKTKVDPASWHYYYEADYDTEEVLWADTLVRGYNRWTFDDNTAKFVSVQLPRQPVLLYRFAELVEPLSSDEVIFRVGEQGLTTEPAGDVVFEEGGIQLRLEVTGATALDFVTPTRRFPAIRLSETEVTYTAVLYASPADDRYVLSSIRMETRAAGGNFIGAHRAWLTAVDAGTQTEFSSSPAGTTSPCASYQVLLRNITDLVAGGTGIAKACHAVCGWVYYQTPGFLSEGSNHLGWLNAIQIRYGISGHTAGGLSGGSEPPGPGQPRYWGSTAYFGRQPGAGGTPTVDPIYDPEGYVVLVYANAIGSPHSLVAHRDDAEYENNTYLTSGDVEQLTGGAFDAPYFSPLGKPHPDQPTERPA